MNGDPLLFALDGGHGFGEAVARHLGTAPAAHEERAFEDGEHKARPLTSVRNRDAFVIDSLHGEAGTSPNDKLCRLLFFLGALKDAGAARTTAVAPYLCYARKDRKTKPRDPVTTRYVAALFAAVGCDSVVTMDVHNLAAYQNAFRCPTEHLEARGLFVEHCRRQVEGAEVAVISPDVGGIKRAEAFRRALQAALGCTARSGFMEKRRSGGVVSGQTLVGDVAGRTVILIDDLISSGGTLLRAARSAREKGAERVLALATHGLFAAGHEALFDDDAIDRVAVTNTVAPAASVVDRAGAKLVVLDAAPLFAEAVRRMHDGGSIVALIDLPETD
jgi:ribose-phosphate pyrophosphokinase